MFNESTLNDIQSKSGVNLPFSDMGEFISQNLKYVFGIAGIVLLIMLISSGYQMIFSKGDPKAMEVAKGKITTSIIGIIILFASFWIVQLIFSFLGVDSNIQIIN